MRLATILIPAWIAGAALALPAAAGAQTQFSCGPGIDITITPSQPMVGDPIKVTFTNNSPSMVFQGSSCLVSGVHATDCTGPTVNIQFCLLILIGIPPGGTSSYTWDQTDGLGTQVPAGQYGFSLNLMDAGFQPIPCCPTILISPLCSSFPANYGHGSIGSGGFVPQLASVGAAQVGNAGFQLTVGQGLGGATGALFLGVGQGQISAPWGTFLLDPSLPLFLVPFSLSGSPGVPGAGSAVFAAPIPNNPTLAGATGYLQVLLQDPGAAGGISHTAGLSVPICP